MRLLVATILTVSTLLVGLPSVGAAPSPARPSSPAPPATQLPAPASGAGTGVLHISPAEALRIALRNSPVLGQYRSRVAQSRYQVKETAAAALPQLSFLPSYTFIQPSLSSKLGSGPVTFVAANNYNIAVRLSQLITDFGRIGWRTAAARLFVKQTEQDYRQQVELLIDQVATGYVQAQLADRNVVIAEEALAVQKKHLRETEVLYRGGVVARYDVLSALTSVSQAQQQLITTRNAKSQADSALLSLLGFPTGAGLTLEALPPPQPPPGRREEALQRAFERRPELESARFAVEVAQSQLSWRKSQHYPALNFTSTYAVINQVGIVSSPWQWNTQFLLTFPILDGGTTDAQTGEAREALEQARQLMEGTRRSVELDVQNAWLDMQNTWEQIDVARQRVAQAREALRVANVRYANGVGTNLEALDAANVTSQAEFSEASAVAQYRVARSHFLRAISGDGPVDVPGLGPDGHN